MNETSDSVTRRHIIVSTIVGAATAGSIAETASAQTDTGTAGEVHTGEPHDFDFLVGHWAVRHHYLRERLAGNNQWIEFGGTAVMWQLLGGLGNVDDNVLEMPVGTRRGVSSRTFNPGTRQWSIWWLDSSAVTIDAPVRGGFRDGVGTFLGDDILNGRPIKARYLWSRITPTSAHWEQAFSPDNGSTWETNWRMEFTRVAT